MAEQINKLMEKNRFDVACDRLEEAGFKFVRPGQGAQKAVYYYLAPNGRPVLVQHLAARQGGDGFEIYTPITDSPEIEKTIEAAIEYGRADSLDTPDYRAVIAQMAVEWGEQHGPNAPMEAFSRANGFLNEGNRAEARMWIDVYARFRHADPRVRTTFLEQIEASR
jgi:hypothetical protein